MTPFDQIAPSYAALWSETAQGRRQRAAVWREIDRLFRPGGTILDLGCGTADDALHLGERGVRVLGIDSSERMVQIAQSRGAEARQLAIENLELLAGPFDGALSNFGALNCVADLEGVARNLAHLLLPSAPLAICVMGRFCWRETLRALATLDWGTATRRWTGRARWRGTTVYYPSARKIVRVFRPYFEFQRRISIGRSDHQLFVFKRSVR
jgi:SAM-dependent methyltransferase